MTVFESMEEKETSEYPHAIGQCPVCGKAAELIGNTGVLRAEHIKFKTLCSNEYYKHVKTERGNDYCYKVNPPKRKF